MTTDLKRFQPGWRMAQAALCTALVWMLTWLFAGPVAAKQTGPAGLYGASYALLIGASDYTAGWPDLESIPAELDAAAVALEQRGFTVVRHDNPDSEALEKAFEDFIDKYGLDTENRLLFLFAGHGHTRLNGRKGYLVPTDAPDPNKDDHGFVRKALSLNQVMSWARRIEARHALFLFDSCFSGTVFKTRDLGSPPPVISELTQEPVRYFITAGKAGEVVPAQSVFTPAFVDAIRFGTADLNQDGYVTGTELGMFLRDEVPKFAPQTPQFGPILDYELSRGDFVFSVTQPQQQPDVDRPPPPPVKFAGNLQVNTDRAADISIDGRPAGTAAPGAPLNLTDLATGIYKIRATAGGATAGQSATVVRGQWTQVVLEFGAEGPDLGGEPRKEPPQVLMADKKSPDPPERIAAVIPPRIPTTTTTAPPVTKPAAKPAAKPTRKPVARSGRQIAVLAFGMPVDDGSARTRVVEGYSQRLADLMAARIEQQVGRAASVSARAVKQQVTFSVVTDSDAGDYRKRLCAELSVAQLITLHMDHQFLGVGMGYATWREPTIDTFDCANGISFRKSYQVNEKGGEQAPFLTQLESSLNSYLRANPLLK